MRKYQNYVNNKQKKQLQNMFQNSYQNGTFFQIFDPKIPQDKLKTLFKLTNAPTTYKVFDKDLKTYVFQLNSSSSKICFPKEDRKDLYLIQQFLNLQIFVQQGVGWGVELALSDLNKTKRRVMLSPTSKIQNKPFFVKFPCLHVQEGIWTNLVIDLYSFMGAFKGQTYRSLDSISLTGSFKLRRIFTTQQLPVSLTDDNSINLLPKALHLPNDIECSHCLVMYEEKTVMMEEILEPSYSQNHKNIQKRMVKKQICNPKTQFVREEKRGYRGEKKFLANTDGPDQKKKKYHNSMSGGLEPEGRYSQLPAISSDKNTGKKTTHSNKSDISKLRMSIDKQRQVKQEQKTEIKNKLNPWRSSKKNQPQTDVSRLALAETRLKLERKSESAETTLFKTKNNLANKLNDSNKNFEQKSDHYSDSQYFQLSQKFSTLTQNRFFKTEAGQQHQNAQSFHRDPDQIQEHIQLQSNQMCESRREQQPPTLKNSHIHESMNNSLSHLQMKNSSVKQTVNSIVNANMMNSYYGFGEKLMNRYMGEVERPYSPPLGEREVAEEIVEKFGDDEKEMEVIYDPVLNCYYDHKTNTYYQLKN